MEGMARTLPVLGQRGVAELEVAWREKQPDWARKRLLVLRLVVRHEHSAQEIADMAGVSRPTVFNYLELFQEGGVEALLQRQHRGGKKALLDAGLQAQVMEELRVGTFRRARDLQKWVGEKTGRELALPTIYYWLGKVGGVLKMPRKTHTQKDPAKVEAFRREAADLLAALVDNPAQPVRLWVADEHRYGLLPVIRRSWSLKGVKVLAPYATKYQWGYLHEAMEVDGDNRIELFFAPRVGKDVSHVFLEQIAQSDPAALHLVVWDQAGFHPRQGEAGVPENIRLLSLPPYSPELNPVEQLGDLVKDAICNKIYPTLEKLEQAILAELEPLRQNGQIIAGMLGSHALVASANDFAKF
jgi:transposase